MKGKFFSQSTFRCNGKETRLSVGRDIRGEWREAYTDFRDATDQQTRNPFAELYAYLARVRLGETKAGQDELRAFLRGRPEWTTNDWPAKLGALLLGDLDENSLFELVSSEAGGSKLRRYALAIELHLPALKQISPNPKPEPNASPDLLGATEVRLTEEDNSQTIRYGLAEACFYAGLKQLTDGKKAKAAVLFRKCLAENVTESYEYVFGKGDLKALGETE